MQPRGEQLAVLVAVGLQQFEPVAHVPDERPPADDALAVAVGDGAGRRVRDVDVADRRVGRRLASRSGNTVLIVVVTQPEKNAGTPIDFSRYTVVQSRQPTGP